MPVYRRVDKFYWEALDMNDNSIKKYDPWLFIGIIAAVAAVIASVTTAILIHEKKRREDEELERYLDCSIQ